MGDSSPTQPTQQTVTQKTEPWDAAKPFYEDLYAKAQTALSNTNQTPYTGELNAGPTATQRQALDLFKGVASTAGQGAAPTNQLAMDTISGKYMDPNSNPYLKGAVQASIDPVYKMLTRNILPSLQDKSISQGAYGGSGYGVAQGLATSDFDQQALDMASKIYAGNYAQERGYQMQAPGLFGAANQLALQPAQLLDQAGSQEQSWNQAADDSALQRYNINQAAPWSGLGEFAQILNGGGFSSVGQTKPGPSPMTSFIQGATGGASILNSLFPKALPATGNWLSSLFSGGGGGNPFANLSEADWASVGG